MSKIMTNYEVVFNKLVNVIAKPSFGYQIQYPFIHLRFNQKDYVDFFCDFKIFGHTKNNDIFVQYKDEAMIINLDSLNLVAEMIE